VKTIDITSQEVSISDLLQWAAIKPVCILSPGGHAFILERADAEFEREATLLGQSDAFMRFLVERAQEPGGMTLDEFEQILDRAEEMV
jgi:hypothetical protein